jgi:predicted cupin superfamily sugar epimerase
MPKHAREWIEELGLEPHPEGGWFRRVYESERLNANGRPVLTSIYYLLESDDFSALHRLDADEQWHFYAGSPLTIHEITSDGSYRATTLSDEGSFQYTVPVGHLFGATVENGYALVGCSVAPGFSFDAFELPARDALLKDYPQHSDLIRRLTRS